MINEKVNEIHPFDLEAAAEHYDKITKKVFDIHFVGIDDWNRPVFKWKDKDVYFGDVNKLWVAKELGDNNKIVNKYYQDNPQALELFGDHFNCEPHGGSNPKWKFNIIDYGKNNIS